MDLNALRLEISSAMIGEDVGEEMVSGDEKVEEVIAKVGEMMLGQQEVTAKVEEVTAKVREMMLGQKRLEAMLQTLLSKPD